jgi:serine/threonine-protein kinase
MASRHADRNLLLGIVAVQNGFISRDDLIGAMNDWVLEKRTPLENILRRRGALAEDVCRLLVTLIEKQLEMHNNDAGRSLAAVQAIGPVREELRSLADPDVQASLIHIAADGNGAQQGAHHDHGAHHDRFATVAPTVGAPTSQGGRFQILRPHARGGLGEVLVALDTELNREVALKRIQSRHADHPQSRARFTLEAEITGGLEHPGVVPIYGLGAYSDGRPYYAMRFIHGDSLKEALEEYHEGASGTSAGGGLLELRKLLGRFVDVCNAVEYAHSRGVLHRDIKPANIMLGKYGETLVVDWGLAKAMGAPGPHSRTESIASRHPFDEPVLLPSSGTGTAPTQMGSAMGTPSYMSPEQAAGRLDYLGPASDVYSLGATLYHVLTGSPPISDKNDVSEQLRKVQKGEFPPPRSIKRDIPKPLEAICLKAMSLAPADRYVTPSALAEEVEHWLADEPIKALPDRMAHRGMRWLRHNWAWAFSAAAGILLVAIVSSVAGIIVNEQKKNVEVAKEQVEKEKQKADALAHSEETAKKRAHKAIDNYVETVLQLGNEESQPVRKSLLKDAREHYEALVKEFREEEDQQAIADNLYQVGRINDSSGSAEEALTALREAVEISKKLAGENSHIITYQSNLAGFYNFLGTLQGKTGAVGEALASYREALKIQERLAAENRSDEYQSHVANTHNNLGALQAKQRSYDDAVKSFRAALAIYQTLAQKLPSDDKYRRFLSNCFNNLAKVYEEQGLEDEATKSYQSALENLGKATRKSIEDQKLLANLHSNLGGLQQKRSRTEALKSYRAAMEIRQKLVQEDRLNMEYQNNLATSYNNVGTLLVNTPEEALKFFRAALEIRLKLVRENSKVPEYQRQLAANHLNIAELQQGAGSIESAKQSLAQAEAVVNNLKQQFPQVSLDAEVQQKLEKLRESLKQAEATAPQGAK